MGKLCPDLGPIKKPWQYKVCSYFHGTTCESDDLSWHTHTFLLLIGGLSWPFRSFEGSEDRMCSSRQKSKLIIEARKQCSCFGSRPPALYPTYVYHTTMWYYHICTCKKELMSWGREVSYHTSIKMRISWWVEAEWETEVAGAAARMDHTQGAANA